MLYLHINYIKIKIEKKKKRTKVEDPKLLIHRALSFGCLPPKHWVPPNSP